MTKIYVAGASAEVDRAILVCTALRAAGHEIAYDWPMKVKQHGPMTRDAAMMTQIGREELAAVLSADVFWLLTPTSNSTGSWVELGVALASGALVVSSGGGEFRNPFQHLALHHPEDAEVLSILSKPELLWRMVQQGKARTNERPSG